VDPYVGIVRGVALGINPAARLVDVTHGIPPQDVRRAALTLAAAYRFFPRGTVHLAVVDPGVGGPRRPLAVRAAGHYFVGPDNGVLSAALACPGAVAVTPTNPAYHRAAVSRTFHARDVFAPVAAHCSRGVSLRRLGPPVPDPVRLASPRVRRRGRQVVGEVLFADHFGNLLTSITAADLPAAPGQCRVEIGGRVLPRLVETYSDHPPGSLGALIESTGHLEIFVRDGSARDRLRLGPGAPVSLREGSARARSSRIPRRSSSKTIPPRSKSTRKQARPSTPRSRWRLASSRPPSPSSGTRTGSPSRTSRSPSG
jgi:S-adenosylmethionine hydrolase